MSENLLYPLFFGLDSLLYEGLSAMSRMGKKVLNIQIATLIFRETSVLNVSCFFFFVN